MGNIVSYYVIVCNIMLAPSSKSKNKKIKWNKIRNKMKIKFTIFNSDKKKNSDW